MCYILLAEGRNNISYQSKLSRSETLNNLAYDNFIWEKIINEISKADCFTIQVLFLILGSDIIEKCVL